MRNDLTQLVFILDRSGSMAGLETDTIGGFNALLAKQKEEKGLAYVTTVLFDDRYEVLHDRENLAYVEPITAKEYFVRGSTALLDAIGRTVNCVDIAIARENEQDRPGKVMFVIITDGMENASREYSLSTIKRLIESHKEKDKWEFLFLGANIDAIATAANIGIDASRAANYHADSPGTAQNFQTLHCAVSEMRATGVLNEDWKKEIDDDFNSRGKGKKK